MIRIICRLSGCAPIDDAKMEHDYKTFDYDLPDLEKYLSQKISYGHVEAIGVEVILAGKEGK